MRTILRIFDYLVCSSEDSVAILSAVVISKMFKDDPNISKDTKVCDLMDYTFSYKLDGLNWEELLKRTTELKKSESSFLSKAVKTTREILKKSRKEMSKDKNQKTARDIAAGVAVGIGFVSLLATAYVKSKK